MNLAPLKYRNILECDGGPVRTLDIGTETILGQDTYSAHAYLRPNLQCRNRMRYVENMPDGAGSAADPSTARFRAISEALERWAFRHCSRDASETARYGFDYDPTTNGMGAYPGLFNSPARTAAESEAIERTCLIHWWDGFLNASAIMDPFEGVRGIEIENPFSHDTVVLLWKFISEKFYTYGFGIGKSLNKACWRAGIELHRTANIVEMHYRNKEAIDSDYVSQFPHLFERRILYFSRPEAFAQIIEKIENGPDKKCPKKPCALIDCKVTGPWDRYVTVWRVVYEQPNRDFSSNRSDYFFW